MPSEFWFGSPTHRGQTENIVDGRIILKCILNKGVLNIFIRAQLRAVVNTILNHAGHIRQKLYLYNLSKVHFTIIINNISHFAAQIHIFNYVAHY